MNRRIRDFLVREQDSIIQEWLNQMERDYPNVYDLQELRKQGKVYFNLIIDTDIPVEKHPAAEHISPWCKMLFHKNVPIDHTLHSSHVFRECLIRSCGFSQFDSQELASAISLISSRIDTFERAICSFFWQNARSAIEEKDRKLEEFHEDKLNLIGKMAASMAHEIRNPLTSILGFLKLIRSGLPQDSLVKVERYLDIIEGEFENIQMQITGFLSFSKKPVIEEQFIRISIGQITDSVLLLITPRLISENIELSEELDKDLIINVQKVPIQQVLSNLLNNSIDALNGVHEEGKRIRIVSREDNRHIFIQVINNGPEIPKDIQGALFQPFITSKMDGTGIGLTICKQIMNKNNGHISFTSTRNETIFTLTFVKPGG